jgi:hypothetical protein
MERAKEEDGDEEFTISIEEFTLIEKKEDL